MNRRGGERELIGGSAGAMVIEWACEGEISFKIPILDNEILMMLQDLGKETDHVKLRYPEWGNRISGYVDIVLFLPFITVAVLMMLPFYLRGFRKLRVLRPDLTSVTIMSMIIAIILPAVSPIWYSPIYLYILSPALLPLFILLKARYLNCLRTVS